MDQKVKGFQGGTGLFEELTSNTLKIVQRTGLPYYLITEHEQNGDSFGTRFCNAVQQEFSKGFKHLIIIGNDTPGLSSRQLLRAAEALRNGKFPLGPSADGGFYLMGLQKDWFDKAVFENLPWQKASLTRAIKESLLTRTGPLFMLPPLADLDSASDLKKFLRGTKNIPPGILKKIRDLLRPANRCWDETLYRDYSILIAPHYNKGSPASKH